MMQASKIHLFHEAVISYTPILSPPSALLQHAENACNASYGGGTEDKLETTVPTTELFVPLLIMTHLFSDF